jgi:hypothetical protein
MGLLALKMVAGTTRRLVIFLRAPWGLYRVISVGLRVLLVLYRELEELADSKICEYLLVAGLCASISHLIGYLGI